MPIQSKGDRMAAGTALVAHLPDQALTGPLGSLDAYLERVSHIPVLSREEERALGERFRKSGDLAAARQLVLSHLRDRKSTRLNSSHSQISYAVFCLKKKNKPHTYAYNGILDSDLLSVNEVSNQHSV